jgi:hypothetical protein
MSPGPYQQEAVTTFGSSIASGIAASAASAARTIALQMLQERGRGAVMVGVARVDAALQTLQPMRNAFAHPPCFLARGVSMASRSGENEMPGDCRGSCPSARS